MIPSRHGGRPARVGRSKRVRENVELSHLHVDTIVKYHTKVTENQGFEEVNRRQIFLDLQICLNLLFQSIRAYLSLLPFELCELSFNSSGLYQV